MSVQAAYLQQSPVPTEPADQVHAMTGPLLFAGIDDGPGLAQHRQRVGSLPRPSIAELTRTVERAHVAGRGGAGFPFARKLQAAVGAGSSGFPRRRVEIVVNLSEGEPASAKDTALVLLTPHTVLDGAAVVAHALGTGEVWLVGPSDRPAVMESLATAVGERGAAGERLRWRIVAAPARFVSGQARAVLELIEGRPGLPVTAWQPEAISGLRGRPTLLSNAETWAHVASVARLGWDGYAAFGTDNEPGTTLLTLWEPTSQTATVREVAFGTPWSLVLGPEIDGPVLVGGYHGTWARPGQLAGLTVSRSELARHGLALGAGVVRPAGSTCPVLVTDQIVTYLAGQSAGRCGPCRLGLPSLASEFALLAAGDPAASFTRIRELVELVTGRGACAHPDGTARLVAGLLTSYEDEVAAHLVGRCEQVHR